MTTQPREMSVTLPVGQAIERVKTVLFRPFDVGKWFVIGFCAWLAYLGEGGGFHTGFNYGGHGNRGGGLRGELEQAREFVINNIGWLAPLVIALVVVGLAIAVVVLWLSSRGRFMFLHCVALNVAEVQQPWVAFAREANSLFLFRLVIAGVSLVLMAPLAIGLILLVLGMASNEAVRLGGLFLSVTLVFALVAVGIVFWIIGRLTTDFVVPLQALRRCRCLEAWRELLGLVRSNVGNFALYLLFLIVLKMAIIAIVVGLVLVTCCIAGCLFSLPYLGTVLLLPILVFERAYPLHYLAQFGPEYNVYPAAGA